MAKSINYRPQLGLDKNYVTDGFINNTQRPYSDSQSDETYNRYEDTYDAIENMKLIANKLPDAVKPNVNTAINTIEFIFTQIDPELIEDPTEDSNNTTPDVGITTGQNDEDNEDDSEFDWLFTTKTDNVIIDIKDQNVLQLINKQYCNLLFEISNDYITSFKRATSQYYADLGVIMSEMKDTTLAFASSIYKLKTSNLSNTNLQHVSDYIIRSQIVRDQKQRMHNKLFSSQESLNRIKACEVARELYIRYMTETYRPNISLSDLSSNMRLEEARLQYESKMQGNLFELYKYLNSSVILLDECLRLYINEAQAKSILIKEEGIKL